MNARDLAFIPADRHHLETGVLVDQVAGIELFAPMEKARNGVDVDRMFGQEIVDVVARKFPIGDLGESVGEVLDLYRLHRGIF